MLRLGRVAQIANGLPCCHTGLAVDQIQAISGQKDTRMIDEEMAATKFVVLFILATYASTARSDS